MSSFPSPCGVLVLKVVKEKKSSKKQTAKFPSPCGVLVLKVFGNDLEAGAYVYVSVPLRGSGS